MEENTSITRAPQINELYRQAETLANSAKANASQAIAVAVQCGKLLCNQKAEVGHGGWLDWLKANCPDISERTAQKYMRLSRKVLELETANPNCSAELEKSEEAGATEAEKVSALLDGSPKTLRQAYIAAGVIPEVEKVAKDTDSGEPTITFTRHIDALVLWYRKRTEHDPIEQWNPETRALLINELRPWAAIYKELITLQDADNAEVQPSQRDVITQN